MNKQFRDSAFREMAFDIYEKILEASHNPGIASDVLTVHLRELTGARAILIYKYNTRYDCTLLSINPKRILPLFDNGFLSEISEKFYENNQIKIIDIDSPILSSDDKEKSASIIVPLLFGNEKIGEILLINLPEDEQVKFVIYALEFLSNIMSLVIRNSIQYENQEEIIRHRTEKITENQNSILHLNSVLSAIRNVNQLIVKVGDESELIKETCELLIEKRGYLQSWIILLNENKDIINYSYSGNSERIDEIENIFGNNKLLPIHKKVLETDGLVIIREDEIDCPDCPILYTSKFYGSLLYPLKSWKNFFGIISVAILREFLDSAEEHELFIELANDIGFALNKMSLEKEKQHTLNLLLEEEQKFKTLFESSEAVMLISDIEDGKVVDSNNAAAKFYGYEKEYFDKNIYLADLNTLPEDIVFRYIEKAVKKEMNHFQFKHRLSNGSLRDVEVYTNPFVYKNKKYLYSIVMDITDKKRNETEIARMIKELINAKETAEKSEILKSEFLAQMSHEIRTPINVILSFTNLIKDEVESTIDPEIFEGFSSVDSASKRIIRTIDLILNMSEVQTKSYDAVFKKINPVKDILEKFIEEYLSYAREKGIDLELNSYDSECNILGDEYSVNQIFANLIDNAIKYTNKGKVIIEVIREDDTLLVKIKDTGIGMSEEYLKTIFKPFRQEEQGYTRSFEGNGLGLALVKNYCDLNKAEINVESTKGVGSIFTVKFNAI
ncbi:MAG: ATP-binding protein [Ignavibacteriaceae bacterium]|nr:ATP-binding protein [Ignavibacteriaceae bacterium]